MKYEALLKIVVDMYCQFGPIWPNLAIFMPVYHQPSKRASCFISILGNGIHKVIFTSEMLGTFFWCHHRLAIAVHYILLLFRLLAASKKYHFDILNKEKTNSLFLGFHFEGGEGGHHPHPLSKNQSNARVNCYFLSYIFPGLYTYYANLESILQERFH